MNEAPDASKRRLFWIVAAAIVVADIVDEGARGGVADDRDSRAMSSELVVRLNLVYNPGSRVRHQLRPVVALDLSRAHRCAALGILVRALPGDSRRRPGAHVGRRRSWQAERSGTWSTGFAPPPGVVDFIDIGCRLPPVADVQCG